jgi:hypothetical protein
MQTEKKNMRARLDSCVLFVVLAVVLGCDAVSYDYVLEAPETHTWPTQGIVKMVASTENGDISVKNTSNDSITAVVTKSCTGESKSDALDYVDNIVVEDDITDELINLSADMPDSGKRDYSADFDITAPDHLQLDLRTIDGNVTAENMTGETTILIVNGDIETVLRANVSAEFDASATNGTVEITGFSSVSYSIDEPGHKAGAIGQGGFTINLSVANGNITIRAD